MKTDRLFQILIIIFVGAAAYFWWAGHKDGIFAAIVFASVCFFLSIRFQAKSRMKERDSDRSNEEESLTADERG